MMKIKSLSLKHFRNIHHVSLNLSSHLNVFVGDNGQGKTNLLEAIVFLSYGRSFRVSDDTYLIESDQEFADIRAAFDGSSVRKMRAVIHESGKHLTLNDAPVTRLSDFIGQCNVVLFHPDDLQFFTQTPKKRRRDIDYELGKLSQPYMNTLSRVMKLIAERNSVLKSHTVDATYLATLSEQIAEASVTVLKARFALVDRLNPRINHYFKQLVDLDSKIDLTYTSFMKPEDAINEAVILNKMNESERRDRDFKVTHVGIHRDDFVFEIDGTPVVYRLSQGQRRLLMVAYKLALIDEIYDKKGSYPIFCMDDLLSELDETRRGRILALLPEAMQCIITTTDLQFLEGTDKHIDIFNVSNGMIEGGR